MNSLIALLFGGGCLLLQTTVLRFGLPSYLLPDPILLLVLFVSLWFPPGRGLVTAFALGMLADLLSGAPEGWNILFAVSIFAVNRWIQDRIVLGRSRPTLGLFLLDFGLKFPYIVVTRTVSGIGYSSEIPSVWLGEILTSLLLLPLLFALLTRSLGLQPARFVDHGQAR
jgi:rod shape-determining protein MreD